MKKAHIRFILLLFMFFPICGSGNYSDPLEGGYITGCVGVHSGKYKRQIEQRRDLLARIRQDTERMKKQLNQAEISNQTKFEQKKIIEHELLDLQKEIEKHQKYIREIEEKKRKINRSKEAEMQEELNRLLKEKERLQQQIEELADI